MNTMKYYEICNYTGTGEPVYDLVEYGNKKGEMGNRAIKKNRKKF